MVLLEAYFATREHSAQAYNNYKRVRKHAHLIHVHMHYSGTPQCGLSEIRTPRLTGHFCEVPIDLRRKHIERNP